IPYVNGAVGKVFAPETVSTTVLNIYRGILNVFQLNIKKTLNVYELQEAGTQGVCKTLYSITEDTEAERVYLRKTRDMSHCQERITKDMGLAYTEKCGKCQGRFLDSQAAVFGVIFRAVKADKKQGYQFIAYMDKTTSRLQIILDDIVPDNNWRLCADGAVLSMHKVKAKINWGAECNQYDTAITAETGLVGRNPAARLKVDWNRLPSDLQHRAKTMYKYICAHVTAGLIQEKDKNSDKQLSLTVAVISDTIIDLIWKTPRIKDLTSFSDVSGKVKHLLAAAGAGNGSCLSFKGGQAVSFSDII
uniref:Vitellogenin domain-containing protein n=1 Tax=Neolamprologus brichardi TaxID=32507 RepID=A0A3Q4MZZ3_NEOBR